jgi:hypothetical protein
MYNCERAHVPNMHIVILMFKVLKINECSRSIKLWFKCVL